MCDFSERLEVSGILHTRYTIHMCLLFGQSNVTENRAGFGSYSSDAVTGTEREGGGMNHMYTLIVSQLRYDVNTISDVHYHLYTQSQINTTMYILSQIDMPCVYIVSNLH